MYTIDQRSNGLNLARDYAVPTTGYAGQEFVPTATTLNGVELAVVASGAPSVVARVRVRRDTITGFLLGESEPVTLTLPPPVGGNPPQTLVRFNFAAAVDVEPGVRHVIEIVPVSHQVVTLSVFADSGDSYAGGRLIMNGCPTTSPGSRARAG
jgi:hypothetical protein